VKVANLVVGPGAHLFDKKEHYALEREDDQEDDNDFGQLVLQKQDDVSVPVMLDDLKDALILRGDYQKEHDCGVSLSRKNAVNRMRQVFVRCNSGKCWGRRRAGWEDAMRVLRLAMIGVVLSSLASGRVSGGQLQQQTQQGRFPGQARQSNDLDPNTDPHRLELQEEARSTERQKRLVADTDKLLALATDLKEQVDKTNKNILSIDVIKKADEIEKLAHSVKERMKG
jgi:hypothetical protein